MIYLDTGCLLKLFRGEAGAGQVAATYDLLEDDLRSGVLYRTTVNWNDVFTLAQSATLAFLTTDERQRKLALAEGMKLLN